jgi:hypothetical protein
MDPDARLRALAEQQHGLITVTQARRARLSPKQLRGRVEGGVLERPSPLVRRIVGSPRTPEQEILEGVWSCGPSAVASHSTAAWLHNLDGIPAPMGRPHILVVRPTTGNRQLATVHQTLFLPRRDRTTVRAIPVTTAARTLADLGSVVSIERLEQATDAALRDGLVSADLLRRKLFELWRPGPTGIGALATVLGMDASARPESWLERAALRIFAEAGLPSPEAQTVVDLGEHQFRLDFTFADGAIVVEVSGHRTHSTRRQRQADAERRNRLLLQGIAIWEFTYEDIIERPGGVTGTIRAALQGAGIAS